MNRFRIVQKRADKRKPDENPCREIPAVLLFVFLLPYVISCLWGHIGEDAAVFFRTEEDEKKWIDERYEVALSGNWGKKRMTMQEYLVRKLEMVMPAEEEGGISCELEALKAQAVLLRTELWGLFLSQEEPGGAPLVLEEEPFSYRKDEAETEDLYRKAVLETDGIFLSYAGEPVKAAFFPVSNGQTRSAAEALQSGNYPYLAGVVCKQDITAADYQSQTVLSKEEYCALAAPLFAADGAKEALWEGLEFCYDSAGYVTEVIFQGKGCNGESFRYALGLPSASFYADWEENEVIFHVKGVGHGFGMSQYDAGRRAVEGETFDNILMNYFFQTELVKIE
ncbi:MAG: SpoIID/LytB domain-containing protein [Blautia sp.]|nr:SpoIID/LytB domain-containing protein [Blautia sp.]MCM1201476.1 SpoIID/LytB domain-containing protein [Bacteroides fragilis]